jgi:hypothetical protein
MLPEHPLKHPAAIDVISHHEHSWILFLMCSRNLSSMSSMDFLPRKESFHEKACFDLKDAIQRQPCSFLYDHG